MAKKRTPEHIRFSLNQRAAAIPQGFRLWFISAYLIIAGIVTIFFNIAFSERNYTILYNFLAIGIILLLIMYEARQALYWDGLGLPKKILAYAVQILLLFGLHMVQRSQDNWMFFPYLIFSTYFQFGKKSGIVLTVLLSACTIVQAHVADVGWLKTPGAFLFIMGRLILIVFFLVLAAMFRKEEDERKKSEDLLRQLEESNRQLKDYSVQAVNLAAVEERNRIAREIHDSVGHYLTVTNIQLEKAMAYQDRDPGEARQAMKDAKWAAAEALKDVRESIHTLREQPEDFSLEEAVNRLLSPGREKEFNLEVQFEGNYRRYNRTILMALYRVIQEGITNVKKHAHARNVEVVCTFGDSFAELFIRDDGKGFDPALLRFNPGKEGGYGLSGISERLDLVRGEMEIKSKPSQGTELFVRVPRDMYQ